MWFVACVRLDLVVVSFDFRLMKDVFQTSCGVCRLGFWVLIDYLRSFLLVYLYAVSDLFGLLGF